MRPALGFYSQREKEPTRQVVFFSFSTLFFYMQRDSKVIHRSKLTVALENQRRVDATEREIIRHHILALQRPALADNVVERRALRVDLLKVDGRREPALAHHLDAEPRFQRAAGAQRVAHITFQRADRRGA